MKTCPESLERCPIHSERDPPFFASNVSDGAVAHSLTSIHAGRSLMPQDRWYGHNIQLDGVLKKKTLAFHWKILSRSVMRFLHDLDGKRKNLRDRILYFFSVTFECIQKNARNITTFLFQISSHILLWMWDQRLIGVSVVPFETGADYFGPSSVWFDGHWWRLSSL